MAASMLTRARVAGLLALGAGAVVFTVYIRYYHQRRRRRRKGDGDDDSGVESEADSELSQREDDRSADKLNQQPTAAQQGSGKETGHGGAVLSSAQSLPFPPGPPPGSSPGPPPGSSSGPPPEPPAGFPPGPSAGAPPEPTPGPGIPECDLVRPDREGDILEAVSAVSASSCQTAPPREDRGHRPDAHAEQSKDDSLLDQIVRSEDLMIKTVKPLEGHEDHNKSRSEEPGNLGSGIVQSTAGDVESVRVEEEKALHSRPVQETVQSAVSDPERHLAASVSVTKAHGPEGSEDVKTTQHRVSEKEDENDIRKAKDACIPEEELELSEHYDLCQEPTTGKLQEAPVTNSREELADVSSRSGAVPLESVDEAPRDEHSADVSSRSGAVPPDSVDEAPRGEHSADVSSRSGAVPSDSVDEAPRDEHSADVSSRSGAVPSDSVDEAPRDEHSADVSSRSGAVPSDSVDEAPRDEHSVDVSSRSGAGPSDSDPEFELCVTGPDDGVSVEMFVSPSLPGGTEADSLEDGVELDVMAVPRPPPPTRNVSGTNLLEQNGLMGHSEEIERKLAARGQHRTDYDQSVSPRRNRKRRHEGETEGSKPSPSTGPSQWTSETRGQRKGRMTSETMDQDSSSPASPENMMVKTMEAHSDIPETDSIVQAYPDSGPSLLDKAGTGTEGGVDTEGTSQKMLISDVEDTASVEDFSSERDSEKQGNIPGQVLLNDENRPDSEKIDTETDKEHLQSDDAVIFHHKPVLTEPRPASPRHASPRPASPRPASPRQASPRPASPRPASPRPASPRPASPRHASPRPASPRPVDSGPPHEDSSQRPGDGAEPRPASPRQASPRPTSPRQASPRPTSPRQASARPTSPRLTDSGPSHEDSSQRPGDRAEPRPASPRQASPRPASPRQASPRPASPRPASPRLTDSGPSYEDSSQRPEDACSESQDKETVTSRTDGGESRAMFDILPEQDTDRAMELPEQDTDRAMELPDEDTDRAMELPDEETDRAMKLPDEDTDRAMELPNEDTDRAMELPDEDINRAMELPDEDTDRAMELPDEDTDRAMKLPDEDTDCVMKLPDEDTDRAMELPDEDTDSAMELPDEDTDRAMELPDEDTDRAMELPDEDTDRAMDDDDMEILALHTDYNQGRPPYRYEESATSFGAEGSDSDDSGEDGECQEDVDDDIEVLRVTANSCTTGPTYSLVANYDSRLYTHYEDGEPEAGDAHPTKTGTLEERQDLENVEGGPGVTLDRSGDAVKDKKVVEMGLLLEEDTEEKDESHVPGVQDDDMNIDSDDDSSSNDTVVLRELSSPQGSATEGATRSLTNTTPEGASGGSFLPPGVSLVTDISADGDPDTQLSEKHDHVSKSTVNTTKDGYSPGEMQENDYSTNEQIRETDESLATDALSTDSDAFRGADGDNHWQEFPEVSVSPEAAEMTFDKFKTREGRMTSTEAQILTGLLVTKDNSLLEKTLVTIANASAFKYNQDLLREAGCLKRLVHLLRAHDMALRVGQSVTYPAVVRRVVNTVTNLAVNEENQKQLQECIPALIDFAVSESAPESVQVSSLQALTNLSVTSTYHPPYTKLIQRLYECLDGGSSTLQLHALKVLVNLSSNPDMVPHLLAAKAPSSLLTTLVPQTEEGLLVRWMTLLANIMWTSRDRRLTNTSLPTEYKAPSPETMWTALYGLNSAVHLRSKVFVLSKHKNQDVRYHATRIYSCLI